MRIHRLLVALLALALVATGCGGGEEETPPAAEETVSQGFSSSFEDVAVYPVFVSSEIVVGENRFLLGLLDDSDAPVGSPDMDVHVSFFDLSRSDSEPVSETEMRFIWTVPSERGLYVGYPTFDSAGEWGAEVSVEGEGVDETVRASFSVSEESMTPAIGEDAPATDTPTAENPRGIERISTDPDPDPRFYETSVAEALEQGEPFVVVFATPAFCASAVCGPTLDEVKEVAPDYPDMTFIHSEIYQDNEPTNPPVEAVIEWGLPSEPWIFVVDADGKVAAKYEGTVSARELKEALDAL